MHVLIAHCEKIPVKDYGGVERIVWWLGKELLRLGHKVTYLAPPGSSCPFAPLIIWDREKPLNDQIPEEVDVVHLQYQIKEKLKKPYMISHQANYHWGKEFDINTSFVSRNHAQRYDSSVYVYNGIDPEEYGPVDFNNKGKYLLFLGYAKRPEKNLKDCAYIARKTGNTLAVVGGKFKWFKWRPWVDYKGFLGGEAKNAVLRQSKALLFPVRWHEPFGIAIIEGFYFGNPMFGTTYGALPELVQNRDLGFLSNSRHELIEAVRNLDSYNRRKIHEYALAHFTVAQMTKNYLKLYERVLNGQTLNLKPPVNHENFYPEKSLLPIFD